MKEKQILHIDVEDFEAAMFQSVLNAIEIGYTGEKLDAFVHAQNYTYLILKSKYEEQEQEKE